MGLYGASLILTRTAGWEGILESGMGEGCQAFSLPHH